MSNIYTILTSFVIGASVGYFLLNAILLLRNHPYRIQRVLSVIFIYWMLWTGKDLLLILPEFYSQSYLDYVFLADGWTAIALAVLIFELPEQGWARWWRVLLLSLPFAAFTIGYILTQSSTLLTAYGWFLGIFGSVVLLIGSWRIYRYMQYLRSEYSNIDDISLSWFWSIPILLFFTQFLWLVISVTPTRLGDIVYYVIVVMLWEATLVHCRRLRPVLMRAEEEEEKNEIEEIGKIELQTACEDAHELVFFFEQKFKRLIHEEQVFRDSDLRLESLARSLGTNRTYLSRYFREVLHTTFYDFINRLRITEGAIPLMREHPEYKLEHVAEESGFKSISTFRRAFLKETGILPKDYIAMTALPSYKES